MTSADIDAVANYWYRAPAADIERMGVNMGAFPPEAKYRARMAEVLAMPESEVKAFALIWEVDGRSIGFCTIKDLVLGDKGSMHLHMWEATARGKGLGGRLFCLSALDFYERFQLKSIICEPKASNPMPNRMLQKVGFPLALTREGASSELSAVTTLNRYAIDRDIAAAYLTR
jgi:RimJ/RimL family protein N-acetyltransferase